MWPRRPLIAHADFARLNEGAEKAKLNFWGVRFRIAPVKRRLQHTRPAYVLDVRPNAQGRLNLALDTFWSNVTMLDGVRRNCSICRARRASPSRDRGIWSASPRPTPPRTASPLPQPP